MCVEGVQFQNDKLQASPRISSPQVSSASPWGNRFDGDEPFLHMPASLQLTPTLTTTIINTAWILCAYHAKGMINLQTCRYEYNERSDVLLRNAREVRLLLSNISNKLWHVLFAAIPGTRLGLGVTK